MNRHVLSILVENHAGVLSRVSGLFSRRGYNIDSLSVGVTDDPKYSRITVVTMGDDLVVKQICNQVNKLIDVLNIVELHNNQSVIREFALIKVAANAKTRTELVGIVDIFRAKITDVSDSSITIEMTGDQDKIKALTDLVECYGIIEIVRTGITGIQRGASSITDSLLSDN